MQKIGDVLTSRMTNGNGYMGIYTPKDREYWVRPCPWCEEILEPNQDEDGYWMPGLIGHSCSGYDEEKIEQAKRTEIREVQYQEDRWHTICKQAGMTDRRLEMTFEEFERDRQPKAYDSAQHFFTMPQSLLFCGPRGTGKTHLASAILHRWLRTGFDKEIEQPYANYAGGRGFFITLPRLLLRIQSTYKQQNPTETEDSIIEFLTSLPLLVLDDVGKEKSSDFSRRALFNLVDGRYVKKTHIIITSNESDQKLMNALGGATYSRMLEMGKIINMKGGYDYRAEQSAKRIKHPG